MHYRDERPGSVVRAALPILALGGALSTGCTSDSQQLLAPDDQSAPLLPPVRPSASYSYASGGLASAERVCDNVRA